MSEKLSVTDRMRASTRRWTLRTIGGMVLGGSAIGTVAANRHITEINGPTVIDEPGEYVLENDIEDFDETGIKIESDRVTLNGNGYTISAISSTISGSKSNGIWVENASNVTIQNLSAAIGMGNAGIQLTNTSRCTVENSDWEVDGDDAIGIRGDNTNRTDIINNNIDVRGMSTAITLSGVSNKLTDNTYTGWDVGFVIHGSNNSIKNNSINSSEYESIIIRGDNNRLIRNFIEGSDFGISLQGDSNRIVQNDIHNISNIGVQVLNAAQNTITNNDIHSWHTGISLEDNSRNNTVARNEIHIFEEIGTPIRDEGDNQVVANTIDFGWPLTS